MAETKKKKLAWKTVRGMLTGAIALIVVLCLVVSIGFNFFAQVMNQVFGFASFSVTENPVSASWNGDYYGAAGLTLEEAEAKAVQIAEEISQEGNVLLKNNGTLPLSGGGTVSAYGWSFYYPVYGGTGSGSVNTDVAITPAAGLENAGFTVNSALTSYYTNWSNTNGYTERPSVGMGGNDWQVPEITATDDEIAQMAQGSDIAILWLGRSGGEFVDLPLTMGEDCGLTAGKCGYNPNKHYLQLTDEEEALLAQIEANYENVIVVINSSNAMKLGQLEADDNVDAILWIGGGGEVGFNAVGPIISGQVNPSGRTADTYVSDLLSDPANINFSDPTFWKDTGATVNMYTNVDSSNAFGYYAFVQYEEGIYVGYRYYETAYVEALAGNYPGFDFDSAVVYPFGYGLSYTTFDWEVTGTSLNAGTTGTLSIDVKVTNTGDRAGKDVVELYYSAPYTPGGIEKSAVVLGDFAKTPELQPDESAVVTLSIAVEDMASYDAYNERAYVLDAGDYTLSLRTDSHNVKTGGSQYEYTYSVGNRVVYGSGNARQSDRIAATNVFDDSLTGISEAFTVMSRADFAGTFPTAATDVDRTASDELIANYMQQFDASAYDAATSAQPITTDKDNGIQLIQLRGLDYDDPLWEDFLDQLSISEMLQLSTEGGFSTAAVERLGVLATSDNDGPAALKTQGLGTEATSAALTGYPTEVVIASTWNTDLAYRQGEIVGLESLACGTNGWYAPGVNTHRSAFAGRNFEYFSEDGVLAGKIAAAEISGVASNGAFAYMKHFAMNEQESYRNSDSTGAWSSNGAHVMLTTWADEQTIREIYLKPFEYVVKNAKAELRYISDDQGTMSTKTVAACSAIMSSFNYIGNTWAGGNSALLETILREEWGFNGTIVTDACFYGFMDYSQMIRNGGSTVLKTFMVADTGDTNSAVLQQGLRRAAHDLCYTKVNSNVYNNVKPGSTITYGLAPWQVLYIAIDCVGAVLVIVCVIAIIRGNKKAKAEGKA